MSIESGDYFLIAFDLESRPIGVEQPREGALAVVVQPRGTQPKKVSNDILMPAHAYSDYLCDS